MQHHAPDAAEVSARLYGKDPGAADVLHGILLQITIVIQGRTARIAKHQRTARIQPSGSYIPRNASHVEPCGPAIWYDFRAFLGEKGLIFRMRKSTLRSLPSDSSGGTDRRLGE